MSHTHLVLKSLQQLADRTLTSQQFVAISESLDCLLLEGEYHADDSPVAAISIAVYEGWKDAKK